MTDHKLDDPRYQNEAEFFDREAQEVIKTEKFKFSNQHNYEQYFNHYLPLREVARFLGDIKGKRLLDLCCGTGWLSIYLARSGAHVSGIDISPKSIEVADRFASENGVGELCDFRVMSAEEMEYADGEFDIILGNAALHHLKMDDTVPELSRCLKPGGKGAFVDDLRHHPVMWVYRALTDEAHTEHERPFVMKELQIFREHFSDVQFKPFHLLNLWPKSKLTRALFDPIDNALLKVVPPLRRIARNIVIEVTK